MDAFKVASESSFSFLNSLGSSLSSISSSNTGGISSVTSNFNAFKTLIESKVRISDDSATAISTQNLKNSIDI